MRVLATLLLYSILLYSEPKDINVLNIFEETSIFNDGVTYNIVTFDIHLKMLPEFTR